MKEERQLAKTVASWLTFEELCGRSGLFNESYLAYPIGQFLTPRYGTSLLTEYPHPVLGEEHIGPGDKPRIDFVVVGNDGSPTIAIETKWLNKSKTLIRDIIRDLVRLELLVHTYRTSAYLVLAGRASEFVRLSNSAGFRGHSEHLGSKPILPYDGSEDGSLRLNPPAKFRYDLLGVALKPFFGLKLANSLRFKLFGPYPKVCTHKEYVTFLWRVEYRPHVDRFSPESIWVMT